MVVSKGQTVTMIFDAPGVSLTAMGRAMSEGGVGDTVTRGARLPLTARAGPRCGQPSPREARTSSTTTICATIRRSQPR